MSVNPMGPSGGLDVNLITQKVVDAERIPRQNRIDNDRTDIQTNISAYGRLRESLDSIKSLMNNFRQEKAFALRNAESSNDEVMSATASTEALAGKYSVKVLQLAQAQKLASSAMPEDTKFGPGEMTLHLGDKEFTVNIKSEHATLVDVVKTINSGQPNPGIRASIIKDNAGSRLILGSDRSGVENQIKIDVSAMPGNALHNFGYTSYVDHALGSVDDIAESAYEYMTEEPETKTAEELERERRKDPDDPTSSIPGWSEETSGTLTSALPDDSTTADISTAAVDMIPGLIGTIAGISMPAALAVTAAQAGYNKSVGMSELQSATDAKVIVDGIAQISSETNVIYDVIQGVDLTLKSTSKESDKPLELDIQYDKQSVKASIEQFVESYNQFFQVSKALGSVDPETGRAGPLSGESVVRSSQSRMKSVLSTEIEAAPESMKSLTELGISTTRQGNLEINYNILDEQLEKNFANLHSFFGGQNGFAKKVEDAIQDFTNVSGPIRTRETSLRDQDYRLNDSQVTLDRRMDSLEKRTLAKFSNMQEATGKMKTQLAGMMNALPG
jgi:flagellar hook-associated protein 2